MGCSTEEEFRKLYDQAVRIVLQDRRCSTSYIQRKLAIGYNKAASLIEKMEDQGIVSAPSHIGKREVLISGIKAELSDIEDAANTAAALAHEINRVWCEMLGDFSQPNWLNAPEWQVESAQNGVKFHISNPDAGDSASHDSWMSEKLDNGWVYGETKDPAAKTHPCIVPFDELPLEQQIKDRLFRATVHAIMKDHI